MPDIKLKDRLHSGIEQIKSEEALAELDYFIQAVLDSEEALKNGLSEREKESIEEGLKDMQEGRIITHDEAMKKYRQWDSK